MQNSLGSRVTLLRFGASGCRGWEVARAVSREVLAGSAIEVVDVEVFEAPSFVVDHRVFTVPTLVLLIDGEETARLSGGRRPRALRRWLETAVLTSAVPGGAGPPVAVAVAASG